MGVKTLCGTVRCHILASIIPSTCTRGVRSSVRRTIDTGVGSTACGTNKPQTSLCKPSVDVRLEGIHRVGTIKTIVGHTVEKPVINAWVSLSEGSAADYQPIVALA